MKLILALALAVVVFMVAEAHRGRKGGRSGEKGPNGGKRGRFDDDDDDKYSFTVTTSGNEEVTEYAVAINNTKVVKVFTKGSNSSVSGSATFYDNTNTSGILIILSRGLPCILIGTSRTHEQNVKDIKALNGTTASANFKMTLLVNGTSIGKDERTAWFESNPFLKQVCSKKLINVATTYDNAQPAPANTTQLNTVSLLSEITILAPDEIVKQRSEKSQGGVSSDNTSEERGKPSRGGQFFRPRGGFRGGKRG